MKLAVREAKKKGQLSDCLCLRMETEIEWDDENKRSKWKNVDEA